MVAHPISLCYNSDVINAKNIAEQTDPNMILLDFDNDPDLNQKNVRTLLGAQKSNIVIALSYSTNVNQVVHAMRLGVYSYIVKSNSPHSIFTEILNIMHHLGPFNATDNDSSHLQNKICGKSIFIHDLREFITQCANHSTSVLLLGESGTGKDLVAETIHEMSSRSQEIFLSINCAAIPDTIIEGEIFGTESGSFTGAVKREGKFELAHHGTLFLNEIAEMSSQFQAKLLSILEKRKFMRLGGKKYIYSNTRIIMATNGDLKQLVAQKKFREDLYYRVMILPFTMLPLRKRKEDIDRLAWHLLRSMGYDQKFFTTLALEKLMGHDWPGNVRELKNCIERAAINSSGDPIEHIDIQFV